MRVMVIVKATKLSETGAPPETEMLEKMGKFNEELAAAGILVSADGLKPSSHGKRIQFSRGKKQQVVDGPFIETKELIAGFWIWKVKSMEEAVEWASRCPDPMPGEDSELEIRPFWEIEELEGFTPELRERNERLQSEIERQKA